MKEELLDKIMNEVKETIPSFNKYLNDNCKPKTRFESTVQLLVIKVSCEKALKKLNQNNNDTTNIIMQKTEILINKITDNILIEQKIEKK